MLEPENEAVLAYLRTDGERRILVVANLIDAAQTVTLDLPDDVGTTPHEVFSDTAEPPIDGPAYDVSLPPYRYRWFEL
jgi:maltose alpha-D-glucosyltransferase/alpha-amylase